jgi:opacity protein-like surface antigen
MAMAAMGNPGHAAAEEMLTAPTLVGATLVPAEGGPAAVTARQPGVQVRLDKPVDFGAAMVESASPWYAARIGAESRQVEVDTINFSKRGGRADEDDGPFFGYAGLGLGKVKFLMDLDDGDLKLGKEKQYKRTQLFLGMGYKMTSSTSLALEYRALTGSNPLYENDAGVAAIGSSTRFSNHNVLMNLRYLF